MKVIVKKKLDGVSESESEYWRRNLKWDLFFSHPFLASRLLLPKVEPRLTMLLLFSDVGFN